ncbi:MAG: Superfamily helicase, family [Gammaproteobacteria bacterium]|jgi:SNF2 family DNA or RNA helicase|nr:Superfamily helicase, family [Gammaproteobacteria bacterium]
MPEKFDINTLFKNHFSPGCVSYGREMFLHKQVSKLAFRSGQAVGATVQGHGTQTYRVNIVLEPSKHARSNIIGTCSCAMGFNCRHVAAVLYQLEANMDQAMRNYAGFEKARYQVWETWLDETYSPNAKEDYSRESIQDEVLLYILSFGFNEDQPRDLFIDLYQSKALKKGGYSLSAIKPAKLTDLRDLELLTSTDILLIQQLRRYRQYNAEDLGERYRLQPETPAEIISTIIKTGRAFWQAALKPLSWQEQAEEIHLDWHRLSHGGFKYLAHAKDNAVLSLWPVNPFLYYNAELQQVGPLRTTLSPETLKHCLSMPIYYPDQGEFLKTAFDAWASARDLPPLPVAHTTEQRVVAPTATLTLYSTDSARILSSHSTVARYHRYESNYSYATITFHYETVSCHPDTYEQNLYDLNDDILFVYPRQWDIEKNYLLQLNERGVHRFDEKSPVFVKKDYARYYHVGDSKADVAHFLASADLELPPLGWDIVYDQSFIYAPAVVYDDWYGEIKEDTQKSWFSLEVGIVVDDEKINLIPVLAKLLQNDYADSNLNDILELDPNELLELTLDNATKIAIPMHRFQTILLTLTELYDKTIVKDGQLPINALFASQLIGHKENFSLPQIQWEVPQELHSLSQKWGAFPLSKNIIHPTDNFKGALRHYQLEGLTWLQFLRQHNLGGILADDMGLGKTVQTLAHLAMEKHHGRAKKPILIISPTSLTTNWHSEIKKFTPDLSVLILQGAERPSEKEILAQHDIILTTYAVILHDQPLLEQLSYYYIILDEAQWIKNANTKAFAIVTQLKTEHRLCLTGTPMENHLGELWSLFYFLIPGYLGNQKSFNKLFRQPIERDDDTARKLALQRRIAPFLLRRAKSVVAADLPPKNEMIQLIDMNEEQATLYESIRLSVGNKIQKILAQKGFAQSHIEILDALLKLRQACCDPRLVKLAAAQNIAQSAKLEYLLSVLPEMIEEGRKILLFSTFTSMLSLIEPELKALGIPYVLLTGSTKDRQTPVSRFQNGEVPLFLLSLKAGGTGLNLTAADTVIHYDPWWNPAAENQASDRAHRIGQNKAVFIYKLITRGSVEEKIIHLQQKKQTLLNDIFANDISTGGRLEADDLKYLLAPME